MSITSICRSIIVALCAIVSCSTNNNLTSNNGSGTQTTNGINIISCQNSISGYGFTIYQNDPQKTVQAKIEISIQLVVSTYQPYDYVGFADTLQLDSTGSFQIDSLPAGVYNLIAYDTTNATALFIDAIPVCDSVGEYSKQRLFEPWGRMEGNIVNSTQATYSGVYVTGTPFFTITDSIGTFLLDRIPVGSYTIKADYFAKTRNPGFTRIKGYYLSPNIMEIFTDSVKLEIKADSLTQTTKLSL